MMRIWSAVRRQSGARRHASNLTSAALGAAARGGAVKLGRGGRSGGRGGGRGGNISSSGRGRGRGRSVSGRGRGRLRIADAAAAVERLAPPPPSETDMATGSSGEVGPVIEGPKLRAVHLWCGISSVGARSCCKCPHVPHFSVCFPSIHWRVVFRRLQQNQQLRHSVRLRQVFLLLFAAAPLLHCCLATQA